MLWRIVGSVLGTVLILVGIPLTISPIPLGIVLVAVGVIILIGANPWFAKLIRRLRKQSKPVDNVFRTAEDILPGRIGDPLRETDVEEDEDEGEDEDGRKMGPPMQRFRNPRRLR